MAGNGISNTRILWVGKRRSDLPPFPNELKHLGCKIKEVNTGAEALKRIQEKRTPHVLVVDAASMRTTGARICRSIKIIKPQLPVILINSQDILPSNGFAVEAQLVHPFTIRKLVNRIKLYSPGQGEEKIKAGPITLNLDRLALRCKGNEELITPRMAEVLICLIEEEGEVVKREDLFRRAWDTDYTGDTRSLDVHVSWIRNILESDPRKPKILVTVRGKGYRLDI
jgi:DNA-binding response OmpR family regulator